MKIPRGFLTFFLSILLFLPAKAGSETPKQPLPPRKIPSQGESPALQKKAPAAQKEPAPPISPKKKEAIFPLTIEKVQVKSLKEVTGGEEAVVILTGKHLDRVVAAEVLGVQVRILKKTPTGLRLKLTGKGAMLKQAAVQVKLRAGAGFKEVPLGNEIRKARLAAAKPELDRWREDLGRKETTKEAGRTREMERARDTARPLDDELPHIAEESPLSETVEKTINTRDKNRGLSADPLPGDKVGSSAVNPVITGIHPDSAFAGDRIGILGTGFGSNPLGLNVKYGFPRPRGNMDVVGWTSNRIKIRVPAPLGTGIVKVGIYRGETLISNTIDLGINTPTILAYHPHQAMPGDKVTIDVMDLPEDISRMYAMYGTNSSGISNLPFELLTYGERRSELEVRLPLSMDDGAYWIALYKGDFRISSMNKNLQVKNSVNPLSGAILTNGHPCGERAIIRLRGGPFERGTDTVRGPKPRWQNGKTFVEVTCDGKRCSEYWNRFIYSVKILPDLYELEVEMGRCFVTEKKPMIRIVYPNGYKSNWMAIQVR